MKVLSGGCCCFQGVQQLLACPKSCDTVSKFTVKVEGAASFMEGVLVCPSYCGPGITD